MTTDRTFIPYGTQWIDEDDIAAVTEVLRSGFLTQGPKVAEFEDAIAAYVGAKYCVSFCNGTAALQCAVRALEIPEGHEGITSPNTFVASANSIVYGGMKPVFADIDSRTFNVTADTIEECMSQKTKLLMPVHFAGQACDMRAISELARKHNLYVIEDAAHAIGSTYADGSMVGSCRYSEMTIFSFHPVKSMTTAEGGCVTTNDEELYNRLLLLRTHGITKDPALLSKNPGPWYYEQQDLSYNFRLTDMQCALGLSQLKKLDAFKARRREIVAKYNEAFSSMPHVEVPFEAEGLSSCFHLYVLQIDFEAIELKRAQVMKDLSERGVGSQVLYIPVYLHPWYREAYGYRQGMCPGSEFYYSKALSLPLFPKMPVADVQRVIEAVKDIVAL